MTLHYNADKFYSKNIFLFTTSIRIYRSEYNKMSQQQQKSATSANDDREKIDKLRKKIFEYIRDKETKRIDDSETVCLLRRIFVACLEKNTIIIDVTLTLQDILVVMNKRLNRIEEKEVSKTDRNSSYCNDRDFDNFIAKSTDQKTQSLIEKSKSYRTIYIIISYSSYFDDS